MQVIGAGGALAGSARGARGGGEDGGRGDRGGTAAVLSWASAVRAVCGQIASFFPRRRNRVSSFATATGAPAGVSSATTQAGGSQAQVIGIPPGAGEEAVCPVMRPHPRQSRPGQHPARRAPARRRVLVDRVARAR